MNLVTKFDVAAEKYTKEGRLVIKVYEDSPAAKLGIKKGWVLSKIGTNSATNKSIFNAEVSTSSKELILVDNDNTVWKTNKILWPVGMVTAPIISEKYKNQITRGQFDTEDIIRFWKEGMLDVYPKITSPIKRYLSKSNLPFARFLPFASNKNTKIIKNKDYISLYILSLSFIAQNKFDEAEVYLEAARKSHRNTKQRSISKVFASLEVYIVSKIANAHGEKESAISLAKEARELSPDIPELYNWEAELTGKLRAHSLPEWSLKSFPVNYTLPMKDPLDKVFVSHGDRSFQRTISTLTEGQFLIILVLGSYRANYYYNEELKRLAILNKSFPGIIKEIHVISSSEYLLDKYHREECEKFARTHRLPFIILWDESFEVSDALNTTGSPARFIVNHSGKVMGTESLMEDEGFWLAIKRNRELIFRKPH